MSTRKFFHDTCFGQYWPQAWFSVMSICPPVRALTNKCGDKKSRMHTKGEHTVTVSAVRIDLGLWSVTVWTSACRMHPAPDIVCKRFSADFSPFPWLWFYYSRYRLLFPCGIPAEKSESILYEAYVWKPIFRSFIVYPTHKMYKKRSNPDYSACFLGGNLADFYFRA